MFKNIKTATDLATEQQSKSFELAKSNRSSLVDQIVVTTTTGKSFNGGETSQERMARAVVALEPLETTSWILSDNTVTLVTREELQEALKLAGIEMTNIWIAPYQ